MNMEYEKLAMVSKTVVGMIMRLCGIRHVVYTVDCGLNLIRNVSESRRIL